LHAIGGVKIRQPSNILSLAAAEIGMYVPSQGFSSLAQKPLADRLLISDGLSFSERESKTDKSSTPLVDITIVNTRCSSSTSQLTENVFSANEIRPSWQIWPQSLPRE
jgi:hypothetical protein